MDGVTLLVGDFVGIGVEEGFGVDKGLGVDEGFGVDESVGVDEGFVIRVIISTGIIEGNMVGIDFSIWVK